MWLERHTLGAHYANLYAYSVIIQQNDRISERYRLSINDKVWFEAESNKGIHTFTGSKCCFWQHTCAFYLVLNKYACIEPKTCAGSPTTERKST